MQSQWPPPIGRRLPFYNRRLAKYPRTPVPRSTKGALTREFTAPTTRDGATLPFMITFNYCGRQTTGPPSIAPPTDASRTAPVHTAPTEPKGPSDDRRGPDPHHRRRGALHSWRLRRDRGVLRPRHELHRRPHHPRRP